MTDDAEEFFAAISELCNGLWGRPWLAVMTSSGVALYCGDAEA